MKYLKYLVVLWMAFAVLPAATAQVYLAGQVTGDASAVKKVRVLFYEDYVYNMDNTFDSTLALDSQGRFAFQLPQSRTLGKVRQLVVYYNTVSGRNGEYEHDILSDFVTEPCDSVNVQLVVGPQKPDGSRIQSAVFTGPGAVKYQCRWEVLSLYEQQQWLREQSWQQRPKVRAWFWNYQNLPEVMGYYPALGAAMSGLLYQYRQRLSKQAYQLMQADIIGATHYQLHQQLATYYWKNDVMRATFDSSGVSQTGQVRQFYQAYYQDSPQEGAFSDEITGLSPDYVDYLVQKEATRLIIVKGVTLPSPQWPDPRGWFKAVGQGYTGRLRDRMLMLLVVDPFKNSGLTAMDDSGRALIEEALQGVKDPVFRAKILASPLVQAAGGKPAYAFELPDSTGKTVRLSDLKGHVVLMDVWYTGCAGCARFAARAREQIYPALGKPSGFKVVSICTDSQRAQWLKSVRSGAYTEEGSINLHHPSGAKPSDFFKLPLVRYYGLEGLPFILLIGRDGRVLGQFTNADSSEKIAGAIQKALAGG